VLMFLTGPLALIPKATLAAVLIAAGVSLFDVAALRELYRVSTGEFWVANVATLGVITIGVVAGIVIAVLLTITTLLLRVSRPHDAILGLVPGTDDYGDIEQHPGARSPDGWLIYRFDASLLFFNAEYFKQRVRSVVAASENKPRFLLLDTEAVSMIDTTAAHALKEVRKELESSGIKFALAHSRTALREQLDRYGILESNTNAVYPSIRSAVEAYQTASGG
jgi:MFS superfamily sulfate permease-like transporter